MSTQELTREQWLQAGVEELSYIFDKYADVELPPVQVSCSWPGGGNANSCIGECWPRSRSGAGVNEIFISPLIEEPTRALDILAHELIHAVDDCKNGHRKAFSQLMHKIGLEGKPTATHAGDRLHAELKEIVEHLGEYPHKKVVPGGPKQSNRQMKVSCTQCGAIFRMSRKWQDEVEQCPCCSSEREDLVFE